VVATQILFIFTRKIGEMIQCDEHMFQMGLVQPPTRKTLGILEDFSGFLALSHFGIAQVPPCGQPPTRKGVVLPVICTKSRGWEIENIDHSSVGTVGCREGKPQAQGTFFPEFSQENDLQVLEGDGETMSKAYSDMLNNMLLNLLGGYSSHFRLYQQL